jgi:serine/threonine protein kinase
LRQTKSALPSSLCEEHKDFTEFVQNKKDDKLSKHAFKMLGVYDITSIQFEENDGTEIPFSDLFEYRTSIGAGGFGFVVAALDKATGEEVALKLLCKDKASDKVIELFKKEAHLLEEFNHPNVVKFRFLKNFSNFLCLGMELCVGGNLIDWILRQRIISYESDEAYEEKWSLIIKNILTGVQYIHDEYEMLHRDIKPGNILFLCKDDLNSLKVWDFGLANSVGIGLFDQNYEKVGTIMYQAPELINESPSYGKASDIWGVGMVLYELLSKGGHPILGKDIHKNVWMTVDQYKEKVMKNQIKFKFTKNMRNISNLAKNLLKNLWNMRPNHRYNTHRALKHPWITRDKDGTIPLSLHKELEMNMNGSVSLIKTNICNILNIGCKPCDFKFCLPKIKW